MKRVLVLLDEFFAISFNEFNDKDNLASFNFRESERKRKEDFEGSFSLYNPLSPKKRKIIQRG